MTTYRRTDKYFPFEIQVEWGNDGGPQIFVDGTFPVTMEKLVSQGIYEEVEEVRWEIVLTEHATTKEFHPVAGRVLSAGSTVPYVDLTITRNGEPVLELKEAKALTIYSKHLRELEQALNEASRSGQKSAIKNPLL